MIHKAPFVHDYRRTFCTHEIQANYFMFSAR